MRVDVAGENALVGKCVAHQGRLRNSVLSSWRFGSMERRANRSEGIARKSGSKPKATKISTKANAVNSWNSAGSGEISERSRSTRFTTCAGGTRARTVISLRRLQIAAAQNAAHGHGINKVRVGCALAVGANLGNHPE